MSISLKFLGAAGTVTGSKYLLELGDKTLLIDAGMFQGPKKWRDKNWVLPEYNLSKIDAVVLTHAHIDHIGILPRFVANGLKCPVYATPATADLCHLLLLDAAYLQEEDAHYRAKLGTSKHKPPLPLYTIKDAEKTLKLLKKQSFEQELEIFPGIFIKYQRAGHIIGAAHLTLRYKDQVINFSGDIGRYDTPILVDPSPMQFGDLLLIESTYGSRNHAEGDPKKMLADVINRTYQRGGTVIIPSFAVGRAQLLLYLIRELKAENKIADIPVVVDSPMASDATEIYRNHPSEYDDDLLGIKKGGKSPFTFSKLAFTSDRKASMQLNSIDEPMIIISASGMLTGGRVLHHLSRRIDDSKNTVLFVGYQPPGSRGDMIQSGADTVSIFHNQIPVRAEIATIGGLSAHADQQELLRWCRSCTGTPKRVAIVHGEPESAETLKGLLIKEFGWDVFIAEYLQEIKI